MYDLAQLNREKIHEIQHACLVALGETEGSSLVPFIYLTAEQRALITAELEHQLDMDLLSDDEVSEYENIIAALS